MTKNTEIYSASDINESTPVALLERLAYEKNKKSIRIAVACHQSTPQVALEKLSKDKLASVRCEVASNKSTPDETLKKLAKDEDDEVRSSVAANKSTPVKILEKLAIDTVRFIRESVADNPATPPEVLERMTSASRIQAEADCGNPLIDKLYELYLLLRKEKIFAINVDCAGWVPGAVEDIFEEFEFEVDCDEWDENDQIVCWTDIAFELDDLDGPLQCVTINYFKLWDQAFHDKSCEENRLWVVKTIVEKAGELGLETGVETSAWVEVKIAAEL